MALRNSPDRSSNASTQTSGLSMKLTQTLAALTMLTASTAASAAETVKKVSAECADGQHMDYTVKDGVFEGRCVDDEEGDKPAAKKHVAVKPKPVPVCTDAGKDGVLETRPQTMSAINTLSKVNVSKEGKYEITEGQSVEFRVNCVDTFNKGKVEKVIQDQARLEAVVGAQVKVTVNGNVVYPRVVTVDGYDVLLELNLPGPVTDSVETAAHHVVVQTTNTQKSYDFSVKADPAKKAQKEAIAKAQKDADEGKKTAEDAKKIAEDARTKSQQAPAPAPQPQPQPPVDPNAGRPPKAKKESKREEDEGSEDTDKYTSYGTAGVSYVSVLGRPSSMASVGASWMDQRAQYTAVGGGVDIGFEQNRETIVQGKETQGGSSTHIFPSVQVALGAQHNGLLGLAKAGPDIEIGNKLVLDNGVTHSGDSGTSFRAELGLGYTVELTKKFGLRLMAVGDVMAGGLDKLGRDDAATRWNAGATISFIGHNESNDQEDTNE